MGTTAKPIASILPQIVGTLAPSATPIGEKSKNEMNGRQPSGKQQGWLKSKLEMKLTHPQLKAAIPALATLLLDIRYPSRESGCFVLYGHNGCGKSHIAHKLKDIFNSLRMNIGPVHHPANFDNEADVKIPDSLFVHWPKAVDGMKSDQWIVFQQAEVEYFVILDDIGAEHDPSGAGLEKLYLILNRREFKRTLITTNFPPEKWEEKFEKRIASRLFRNSTRINLSDVPDYNSL